MLTARSASARPLRIAYARVFTEACVGSPLPTTLDDFERMQWWLGDELGAQIHSTRWELPGLIPLAELKGLAAAARIEGGVELVPLLSAFAVPSGKLARDAWARIRGELLDRLDAAGSVDGVFLALHGSMRVEGMEGSPEAELLAAVKARAPGVRIAATFDLHANLVPGVVAQADIIQSFRANPHWDLFPSGFRAGRSLIRTLRGQIQPETAWRKLPVVLGGGTGLSFSGPSSRVFRLMKKMHRDTPGLLHTSFNMAHVFSDSDDVGWSVHVTTDGDRALAERLADQLAEAAWEVRRAPLPRFLPLDEALAEVRARGVRRRLFPSTLIDMGDGVLSGATGGSTYLLRALVASSSGLCTYVPLHDPALVARAGEVSEGATLRGMAAGTPGLANEPVAIEGRVCRVVDTKECGLVAHLDLGEVQLVASDRPPLSAHPSFFTEVGLNPRRADAIVQKSFFHFRVLFAGISHHAVPVATPGPSDLYAAAHRPFPYPRYPAEDLPGWREFDRRERGEGA